MVNSYDTPHLAPPPNPPFPFPFRYFAETQPQLQQLNLSLEFDKAAVAWCSGFSLTGKEVAEGSESGEGGVTLSLRAGSREGDRESRERYPITLPAECDLSSISGQDFIPSRTVYDIRLPLSSDLERFSSNDCKASPAPFSAKQFQSFQPTSVNCSHCHTSLATLSTAATPNPGSAGPTTPSHSSILPSRSATDLSSTYKALPSEHYQELIEAYLCHPSGEFAKKFETINERGFWPSYEEVGGVEGDRVVKDGGGSETGNGRGKAVVLVGDRDIRVDEGVIAEWMKLSSSDLVNTNPSKFNWTTIQCQCDSIIGERNIRRDEDDVQPDRRQGEGMKQSFKLWKHSTCFAGGEENLRYPPEVFVLQEMLGLAQAHSTRRFRLEETERADETEVEVDARAMLWLFQPDLKIGYGGGEETEAVIQDVAKVLFQVDPPPTSGVHLGKADSIQIETLTYPRRIIDTVLASLARTNGLLPVARRKLGLFEVGYLVAM